MLTTPVNAEQFAHILFEMRPGDSFTFAVDGGIEWPNSVPDNQNCTCWYYAAAKNDETNASEYIILDYCGGGSPMAIPTNYKYPEVDELKIYVTNYFAEILNASHPKTEVVFIDSEDFKVSSYIKIASPKTKCRSSITYAYDVGYTCNNPIKRSGIAAIPFEIEGIDDETQLNLQHPISTPQGSVEFQELIDSLKQELDIKDIIYVKYTGNKEYED